VIFALVSLRFVNLPLLQSFKRVAAQRINTGDLAVPATILMALSTVKHLGQAFYLLRSVA
jgi:hypothetical protein